MKISRVLRRRQHHRRPEPQPLVMGMCRHLLVALNESAHAHHALREAGALAQANRSLVSIVTVVAPPPLFMWATPIDLEAVRVESERLAQTLIRDAVASFPDDVSVTSLVRRGNPGKEIVAVAREVRAELIVLGCSGRRRLASPMLGNVSAYVRLNSPVPHVALTAPDLDARAYGLSLRSASIYDL